jgi:hypothetical protein
MGDLIISARKGEAAVHPLKVQWWPGCPPFRGVRIKVSGRALAPLSADVLTSSSALFGSQNLASCMILPRFFAMHPSVSDTPHVLRLAKIRPGPMPRILLE